jgi:hypothetical protein
LCIILSGISTRTRWVRLFSILSGISSFMSRSVMDLMNQGASSNP